MPGVWIVVQFLSLRLRRQLASAQRGPRGYSHALILTHRDDLGF